ncbi:MAG: PTS-dependent dihydroxyacetone kinase phosphotransferase subunit DhaM [Thermomicrobiales bacterium]|jgi:dihydroxyacetone kinase phosphotransfer subunit|nr:PTS-dependent dihydroxyacetone kinase phosphotransferase subunit DhaM [Thermomicrobiales bacterium]
MPVGIVIVSHSRQLAEGVREMAEQMAGGMVAIRAVGGTADGELGTNPDGIREALAAADAGDGILVLMDLGSAVLSAETAIELAGDALKSRVILSDAPLVEGAVVAAVEASIGNDLDAVAAAALGARDLQKVSP